MFNLLTFLSGLNSDDMLIFFGNKVWPVITTLLTSAVLAIGIVYRNQRSDLSEWKKKSTELEAEQQLKNSEFQKEILELKAEILALTKINNFLQTQIEALQQTNEQAKLVCPNLPKKEECDSSNKTKKIRKEG